MPGVRREQPRGLRERLLGRRVHRRLHIRPQRHPRYAFADVYPYHHTHDHTLGYGDPRQPQLGRGLLVPRLLQLLIRLQVLPGCPGIGGDDVGNVY